MTVWRINPHRGYRSPAGSKSAARPAAEVLREFSKFSKSLIVEFIRKYFIDEELAGYIIPRRDFIVKPDKAIDRNIFIDTSERDIDKIEKGLYACHYNEITETEKPKEEVLSEALSLQ